MGTSNFNLQYAINNYISLINNQGSVTASDVAELTAHLYDSTEYLHQMGLSEEEAFIVACKRIGDERTLTEEYGKVNPSIHVNKTWAFLFIGFNLLYVIPSIAMVLLGLCYYLIDHYIFNPIAIIGIITFLHALLTIMVWFVVIKKKEKVAQFIERRVSGNAMKTAFLSFVPYVILYVLRSTLVRIHIFINLNYPLREVDGVLAEVSFYLLVLSVIGGIAVLLFSIDKKEQVGLKTYLEKPSFLFLLALGIFTELLAACTRALHIGSIIITALLFGVIYFLPSFFISYYNKSNVVKHLTSFAFLGVFLETTVGIQADLHRGSIFTVYFVLALLIGVITGKLLGQYKNNATLTT